VLRGQNPLRQLQGWQHLLRLKLLPHLQGCMLPRRRDVLWRLDLLRPPQLLRQ
jgi:hypothetical protein